MEWRDTDKVEKVKSFREALKRVNISSEVLPSICCYTLLNANHTVICAEISDDSAVLAVGLNTSIIKVFSLVPQKLRSIKAAEQLSDIDPDADDVWVRIMDDRNAESTRVLIGHNGPVFRISFNPDRTQLLSCSEDGTIRLWSLLTWTCVVTYKGHIYPVWDVKFSPHGYYFCTASNDRTARLWATDHHQPLRVFAGHFSDVDCCQFHPNSNYIATGSSDRTIRLWDCLTGNHVRVMSGHKGLIYTIAFSLCGRFLVSSGSDCVVLLWDMAHGHLLAELSSHTAPIHCLTFSRENSVLASGSLDSTIKLWDFTKIVEDILSEDVNVTSHNPDVKSNKEVYMLRSFNSKNSPFIHLQFSRRNVLLAITMFDSAL